MPTLNFLTYLNAYSDRNPSNSPSRSNFKWTRELNGVNVNNPYSLEFNLAPGETRSLFSGTRTLLQDNTTQYSISLVPMTTNTYQLTWVGGTAPAFRTTRSIGVDATTTINVTLNSTVVTFTSVLPVAASFVGQIAGMTTNVTITATNLGISGNSVLLPFDGATSISSAISAWNTANPSNLISLTSGDGTQIPTASGSIALSGGVNGGTPLNLSGIQVGDYVTIGSNFNAYNQGQWQIISFNSNSFSIVNDLGVAESIVLGSNFSSQLRIYSALGVQVNDILSISEGFSPVTQGNYPVTLATDTSLQFVSAGLLPQEGPITTEDISVYYSAKRLIYIESDQTCNVVTNGNITNSLQPLVNISCGCATNHGFLLLTSTIFSLSITNTGLSQATLYLASVE